MCQLIWIWRVAAQRRLHLVARLECIYVHDHVTSTTNCTLSHTYKHTPALNLYSAPCCLNKDVIKKNENWVFYMWISHSSIYDLRSLCGAYPSNRLCDTHKKNTSKVSMTKWMWVLGGWKEWEKVEEFSGVKYVFFCVQNAFKFFRGARTNTHF